MKTDKKVVKKPKFFKAPTGEFSIQQVETVEFLSSIGLNVRDIASYFKMSKATFERRYAMQPEIYEAMIRGRAVAHANVAKKAYDMAVDGKHPEMTRYWLNCKAGWKQEVTIEVVPGEGGSSMAGAEHAALTELLNLSDQELAERRQILEMELVASGRYQRKSQD